MPGLVDAQHANASVDHIDLVDAAGLLREPPERRQGLIEQLDQQRSVQVIVRDENNRLLRMASQNEPEHVGRTENQILQRFPVRKSHEVRGKKPSGIEYWIGLLELRAAA
jgi:hypothetical protein